MAINSGRGAMTYCPEVAAGCATYVDVLNIHLPSTHQSPLARSWIKNRQVLIDWDASEGSNHLQGLTEHKLVTKANEAIAWRNLGLWVQRICETVASSMSSTACRLQAGSGRRRRHLHMDLEAWKL